MTNFHIDPALCIGCAECAHDCPADIITMNAGHPTIAPAHEKNCLGCLHCVAVCKVGALSIHGLAPQACTPLKDAFPTLASMECLVKGRRSVRRFSPAQVDKKTIHSLIQTVSHAPTGRNHRSLLFTVVDDANAMNALRHDIMEGVRTALRQEQMTDAAFFKLALARWDAGTDIIFRHAPHMLWVTAPQNNATPQTDPVIALSNFDLLAVSAGLGTLWCGFALRALTQLPHIARAMHVPEDHVPGYIMMFGRPAVRYHRTVEHGPAHINSVAWHPADTP